MIRFILRNEAMSDTNDLVPATSETWLVWFHLASPDMLIIHETYERKKFDGTIT
jgi:hypothetical protein